MTVDDVSILQSFFVIDYEMKVNMFSINVINLATITYNFIFSLLMEVFFCRIEQQQTIL